MKATILDDLNKVIVNVIKVNEVGDQGTVAYESWHQPNQKYTLEDGVRIPILPESIGIPTAELENGLWSAYRSFQGQHLTDDLSSMYYMEKGNSPKAQAIIDWKDNVWTQYYIDKGTENYSPDFEALGVPPYDYLEVRDELGV